MDDDENVDENYNIYDRCLNTSSGLLTRSYANSSLYCLNTGFH